MEKNMQVIKNCDRRQFFSVFYRKSYYKNYNETHKMDYMHFSNRSNSINSLMGLTINASILGVIPLEGYSLSLSFRSFHPDPTMIPQDQNLGL